MYRKITLFIYLSFLFTTCIEAQTPDYSFQFTNGSLADESGSPVLTSTGGTRTLINDRAGNSSNAIQLNNDQLSFSGVPQSQEFTVSFFIKTTDNPLNPKFIITNRDGGGLGYMLALRQGKFEIFAAMESNLYPNPITSNFSSIGNYTVNNGQWHHVALVAESYQNPGNFGFLFKVYVDGNLDSQSQLAGQYNNSVYTYTYHHIVNTSEPFEISQDNPSYKFKDGIDDIKYFTEALTASEVAALSNETPPCLVNIPDANFKSYLVGNAAINTNSDTEIQCSEAQAYTGIISVSNQNIADLTGIEAFTNITGLYCGSNQLTNLNISANTSLEDLYCSDNNLTALNVSTNTNLSLLRCDQNQLTTLDLSNNTALTELWCYSNQLTSLNISNNTALTELRCQINQITALDVSNNTDLEYLNCYNNKLTALDISHNTALSYLNCSHNSFLTTLDAANGNNRNFSNFVANFNPNLSCIEVDDANYSTTNWTNIDASAQFSVDCSGGSTNTPPVLSQNHIFDRSLQSGATLSFVVSASDADNDALTFDLDASSLNKGMTIGASTGTFQWLTDVQGSNDGTHTVTITVSDGIDTDSKSFNVTVGGGTTSIQEIEKVVTQFYPNPVHTHLNIELQEAANLKLVNLLGNTIATQKAKMGNNTIDVGHLPNGVYYLQVGDRGALKVIKK